MVLRSATLLARVYGGGATSSFVPGSSSCAAAASAVYPAHAAGRPIGAKALLGRKARQGSLFAVANDVSLNEKRVRQQLNALLADERDPFATGRQKRSATYAGHEAPRPFPQRKLVNLPGVERVRDLPADPITRLFFQHQGDNALY